MLPGHPTGVLASKLLLAYLTTPLLNIIPMACVGGILAYVALNMVKPEEVAEVFRMRIQGPPGATDVHRRRPAAAGSL